VVYWEIMKKILTIVLPLLFLLLGVGVFVFIFFSVKNKAQEGVISPTSQVQPTAKPQIEWGLWQDQFGFSFEYPTVLEAKQEEVKDKDSYVVLSSPLEVGKIVVSFGEAPQETIGEWFKAYKEATASSKVEDIKLSERQAKKIIFEGEKRLVTAMIDEGDLIIIDGNLGQDELWNKAYDRILTSFYLEPVEEKAPTSGGEGGMEGEELFLEGEIEE